MKKLQDAAAGWSGYGYGYGYGCEEGRVGRDPGARQRVFLGCMSNDAAGVPVDERMQLCCRKLELLVILTAEAAASVNLTFCNDNEDGWRRKDLDLPDKLLFMGRKDGGSRKAEKSRADLRQRGLSGSNC